ncbi:hypothetical protein [Hyphomonas sp.]|uniref:hypothetical protein n=1 Tax=Hyphomonas sp. TaxID=87 RepID=UPI0025BDEDE4|nr:hypothetical protein [Hyphomonas sp.]
MGTWMLIGAPSAFGAAMVAAALRKGAVSLRRIFALSIGYAPLAIPVTLMFLGALGAMEQSIRRDESLLTIVFATLVGAGGGALMTFALPILFYGAGMLLALAFSIPAGIACALVFRLIAFERVTPAPRLPVLG